MDIVDPVYERPIRVAENEKDILTSPTVQRMRRITQLGHSAFIYPGANHTRFEHSLGVMHTAGRIAESVNLSDDEITAYRLAGLLHDIGHTPYSHNLEPLLEDRAGYGHEELACKRIDKIDADFPVSREWIKNIILGKDDYKIVAGSIDADRMDYILRDTHHSGIRYGNTSVETIFQYACIEDGSLAFDANAIRAIKALLEARLNVRNTLHQHHTSKIVRAMFRKSVRNFLSDTSHDIEEIADWDDAQLHSELLTCGGNTQYLYQRVASRDIFDRAVFADVNDVGQSVLNILGDVDNPREVEEEIAADAGIPQRDVIVDPPVIPSNPDEDIPIRTEEGVRQLSELRDEFFDYLEEEKWQNTAFGVYTTEENVPDVKRAAYLHLPV